MRSRLAFDVGGTFTDVVVVGDDGRLTTDKILTTSERPELGAVAGSERALAKQSLGIEDVTVGVHGTTLVTNAIIERQGATVGMLTTEGFEDAIEIGHGERYDMYDLFLPFPEPLVARRLRRGVRGRIGADGAELEPLGDDDVLDAIERFRAEGVTAVCVCFLHAHANPAHERRAATLLAQAAPELVVTLSSDVSGKLGEYERFSTAAANAYVQPRVRRYLTELDEWLSPGELLLMGSNGGAMTIAAAKELPIALVESGPAAGALAASALARRVDRDHVISFDMGGTTAKVCLVDDGQPVLSPEFEAARAERFKPGSGIPLSVPVINLIEIGAGGGSIARRSPLGLLKVGPHSAGSEPGPACYGRGGLKPTVTDANVLLGFIGSSSFLGGEMALDREAAEAAVARLAEQLGLDTIRTAAGIYDVVNENMAAAMRSHVAERNRDPRNYSLIAFGGAGPVHAVAVARKVGVPEVIVSPGAGVMSALGLLSAPMAVDLVQSAPGLLEGVDWEAALALLAELADRGRTGLAGVAPDEITIERSIDLRYIGQAHELTIPLPDDLVPSTATAVVRALFAEAYVERYSVLNESFAIEVLNWRARVSGPSADIRLVDAQAAAASGEQARGVWDHVAGAYVEALVVAQAAMELGRAYAGPLIVEQPETTTVIGVSDRAHLDELGNLIVQVGR
ncbi:MAG: hydantoinase/oxoprolinase family protein [Gaiellales bacterium]